MLVPDKNDKAGQEAAKKASRKKRGPKPKIDEKDKEK